MGWLFSQNWPTRKDLVKHLTEQNGVKTLKKFFSGNHMWCVHEYERNGQPVLFICLYILAKGPLFHGGPNWGYKDVDESMGPAYYTCPESFLDYAQPEPEADSYAGKWRAEIRRRGTLMNSFRKGMRVRWSDDAYYESDIDSFELLQRRSPSCFVARGSNGNIYRLGKGVMSQMEIAS